jgi:hypothetical protein
VTVPVAWFTTVYEPESASVPASELCDVSVCRFTVATEVRYALPAAPGPFDPDPLNAPAATATTTPDATTTITTPAATQPRPPRRPVTPAPALRPEEMVPLTPASSKAAGCQRDIEPR